jgi:hypothetical protein
MQSTVVGACPIGGNFVVFLQGVDEMVCMIDVGVLDAKIVNAKCKLCGKSCVLP